MSITLIHVYITAYDLVDRVVNCGAQTAHAVHH